MTPRCKAYTKKGKGCMWAADPVSGFCLQHDPARADERREVLSARGKAGKAKQTKRRLEEAIDACSLRTTDDLLARLERSVILVENSGADAVQKAGAIVKLVAEARAVLKAAELETENKELKQILVERHPELRKHLRMVP